MFGHSTKRGVVLVTAVVFTAFLATLVVTGALYIRDGLGLVAIGRDEIRGEGLIRAGVELAGGLIIKDPKFIGDGQPYDFSLDGGRVIVYAVSEDAKVDLNKADRLLIEGLFRALGADSDEARAISDQIVSWRDASGGQSASIQAEEFRQNRGLGPAKHPFRDPAELRNIPGISLKRVEQALPYVTVLSSGGTIYLPGASETVLSAIPGVSPERAREIVKLRRRGASAMESIRPLLGDAIKYIREDRGTAFSLLVEAELERGYRQTAAVEIVGVDTPDAPYRVVSWNSGSSAETTLSAIRLSLR
jgi:type II secretory pathway component PulK